MPDCDEGYPVRTQIGDRDLQILYGKGIALDGDSIQLLHDPAADGNTVRFQLDTKEFHKILQADGAVHAVGILVQLFKIFFHLVVFVPNFTDQFFQNILHRNNTKRPAKIVYDYGDMGLLMLEHFQNIPDFCVLIDKQRLRHNLRNGLIRHLAVDIEVLLMKNADDLIDGIPVDQ